MRNPEKIFFDSQEEESKESKTETKEEFRKFFKKEQIQLPQSEWSSKFKEYESKPIDIEVVGKKPNVYLEEVLIIKKT